MKSKVAAALLALFLGDLGIHRFYLGETGMGILYLFLGLIGALTALIGIGLFFLIVLCIICFIDFIRYLVMSDEKFDRKYNNGCSYIPTYSAPVQQQPTYERKDEPKQDPFKEKAAAIKQLKELLDSGVLTQEEFESEKSKILNKE